MCPQLDDNTSIGQMNTSLHIYLLNAVSYLRQLHSLTSSFSVYDFIKDHIAALKIDSYIKTTKKNLTVIYLYRTHTN